MEQQLGFCTTSDGISIAYAMVGDGPPLVYATGWPGHLSSEWEKPHSRELLEELAQGVTLIRYDMRGSGLSDRDPGELSFENWLLDLEAVVDHLEVESFPLLSLGFLAGPITIAYAAAHQDRVTHLILSESFARGSELTTPERAKTLVDFISLYGRPDMLGNTDLGTEDLQKFQDVTKIANQAASVEVQAEVARTMFSLDVTTEVEKISMPVLVMHGHDSQVVPFALGRNLAASIPHSKFVPFEKSVSTPWLRQDEIITEIRRFLDVEVQPRPRATRPAASDAQATPSTERGNVERKLAAILSADVVGYSRMMGEDEEATVNALAESRSLVERAVRKHDGRIVDFVGDNFMAEFPNAAGAMRCALDVREDHAEARVRYRMGVHLGDVRVEGDRLFGPAVNIAARLQEAAPAGDIFISDVIRQQIRGTLKTPTQYIRQSVFKNIEGLVPTFRVLHSGERPRRVVRAWFSVDLVYLAVGAAVVAALAVAAVLLRHW